MNDPVTLSKHYINITYQKLMSGKWQVYRSKGFGELRNNLIGKGRNMKEARKDLEKQEKIEWSEEPRKLVRF
jgi:hypothetical protein